MSSPTVRLVAPNRLDNALPAPSLRLAIATKGSVGRSRNPFTPSVRLAYGGPSSRPDHAIPRSLSDPGQLPGLLCSLVYLDAFLRYRSRFCYRDWVIDSGAYSAFASGTVIVLGDYIRRCRELTATDPTLTEIYSLDVIGDWRASARNTEKMWKAGIEAIPCYHFGEPRDVLLGLARDYPKIALGGVARMRGDRKRNWARECVSAVWPKKVHGFGFGSEEHTLAIPFHSTDATNWEFGPCAFGRWHQFGNLNVRGSKQNLRGEVRHYLELESRARAKWAKEMAELEAA